MSDNKVVKFPKSKQPRPSTLSEREQEMIAQAQAEGLVELAKTGFAETEAMKIARSIAEIGEEDDSKH
ncbi:hypothetical protein [Bradyrhizobium sp. dw_411]|uniref:hypothetical protein n=1 Tax=Bradyrhizobium sp. dw_411 TaxID=2720082 RepID=UPI001BCC06FA|nr:hypothetical protein [Bradyrhizobium sp. dw_411]